MSQLTKEDKETKEFLTILTSPEKRKEFERKATATIDAWKCNLLITRNEGFFARLVLGFDWHPNWAIPTLATDGKSVHFNPWCVERVIKTVDEGAFCICHEALHGGLLHITRRGDRQKQRWNRAIDWAVNILLLDSGYTLPNWCIGGTSDPDRDRIPEFRKLTEEQIYELLPPDEESEGGEGGCDCDNGGKGKRPSHSQLPGGKDSRDSMDVPAGERSAIEERGKLIMDGAVQGSKGQGDLPAGIARLWNWVTTTKIDYRQALPAFVKTSITKDDYSWSRRDRRAATLGIIAPGLYSTSVGRIGFALDASGSIGADEMAEFVGQASDLVEQVGPREVDLVSFDAEVYPDQVYSLHDFPLTSPNIQGGGGTDFRPIFSHYNENPPECLVIFTDTYGTFPETAPPYPVLWVIKGPGQEVPFGATCYLPESI